MGSRNKDLLFWKRISVQRSLMLPLMMVHTGEIGHRTVKGISPDEKVDRAIARAA
jgi:hypothetical protein